MRRLIRVARPVSMGLVCSVLLCAAQTTARAAGLPQDSGQTPYVCQASSAMPQTGAPLYIVVVHGPANATAISSAWMRHILATYPAEFDPNIYHGGVRCRQLSALPAAQQNSVNMIEQQWTAQKGRVVPVAWEYSAADSAPPATGNASTVPGYGTPIPTYGAPAAPHGAAPAASSYGAPAASTPSPAAQGSSGSPTQFYISCSTSGGAGINMYYTSVFLTDKLTSHPSGPGNGHNFFAGKRIDDASIQVILNDFQQYLKGKGYKYLPGSTAMCDIDPNEAKAKAEMHKRAYEGNPCSNCGKVVETGWKDE